MMQARASILILLCFLLSLVATPAAAVEFAVVGPRAAGMGGAGVAVTTDAYATYWNPAGLAMVKSMDIRIQGTVQVTGRDGIVNALDDLKDFNPNDTSAGQSWQRRRASPIRSIGPVQRFPGWVPPASISKVISASMPLDSTCRMSQRREDLSVHRCRWRRPDK